jgi:RHS repeat-associated protein
MHCLVHQPRCTSASLAPDLREKMGFAYDLARTLCVRALCRSCLTKETRLDATDNGDRLLARTESFHDKLGRVYRTKTYAVNPDNGTVGDALVSDTWYDALFEYNHLGQPTREYQEHAGAKDGNTLYVEYAYDTTASGGAYTKGPRPTSVRYPNGRRTHLNYGSSNGTGDVLGRIEAIQDDNGGSPGDTLVEYTYLGSGRIVVEDYVRSASSHDVEYTYTGRRLDGETGMYYYRHRIYHAGLGRFLTRDPIGYRGGDINILSYVSSSPISHTDPTGLKKEFLKRCTITPTFRISGGTNCAFFSAELSRSSCLRKLPLFGHCLLNESVHVVRIRARHTPV